MTRCAKVQVHDCTPLYTFDCLLWIEMFLNLVFTFTRIPWFEYMQRMECSRIKARVKDEKWKPKRMK